MPGDWLRVGGPEPVITEKTVYVERFSLRSPQRSRSVVMLLLDEEMSRQGHTAVGGTAKVQRNRDYNGRFMHGWTVTVGAIRDGQRIGLGQIIALQRPWGPLHYFEFQRGD